MVPKPALDQAHPCTRGLLASVRIRAAPSGLKVTALTIFAGKTAGLANFSPKPALDQGNTKIRGIVVDSPTAMAVPSGLKATLLPVLRGTTDGLENLVPKPALDQR